MQIQKLEINGFKSFKNKTVLEFTKDEIIGIVGPNGCGKSNIVDALLWVMGETSPKHLRSQSLSDVIFSGTNKEAPSGMAEVSLTLSKGTMGFPEKYKTFSEIMITRRSFRDGKTEYLINKQPCLLRDIKEIFMNTGAGCRGFSIIEQEAIEKLITAKPHERRFIIEEVAGITKFKTRKQESARKLELVNQNLKRLDDILKTQEKQLNHLSSQAKKAEKYRALKEEIQTKEIEVLHRFYEEISKEQQDFKDSFLNQKEKREQLEQTSQEKESQIKQVTQEWEQQVKLIEQDKNYLEQLNYKLIERKKEIEKIEETVKLYQDTLQNQETLEVEQQEEIKNSQKKLEEIKSQKQNLLQKEEQLKKELVEIEQFLSDHYNDSNPSEQKEEVEKEIQQITQENLDKESQLLSMKKQIQFINKEQDSLEMEMIKADQKIKQTSKDKSKTETLIQKNQQMKLDLDKDLSNLTNNLGVVETKCSNLKKEIQQITQNKALNQYKIEELEKLIHQFENLNEGSSHLSSSQPKSFKPLFKHLKIEAEFEQALVTVLGLHAQALITENSNDIEKGIQYLKENKKGKSSFLSRLPTSTSPLVPQKTLEKYPSFICYLEDKIKFDLKTEMLKPILHNTVVISDLRSGFELKKTFPQLQFVTKEGDLIAKNSIVHGGSSEKETNFFKLHNQIEKNQSELKSNQVSLELKQIELQKATKQFNQMEANLSGLQKQTSSHAESFISFKKDLERLTKEQLLLTETRSSFQTKYQAFEQEKESLIQNQSHLQEELNQVNKIVRSHRDKLKSLQDTETHYKKQENKKIDKKMEVFQTSKEISGLNQEATFLTHFIEQSLFKNNKKDQNKQNTLELIEKKQEGARGIQKEVEIFHEEKLQHENTLSERNSKLQQKAQLKETLSQEINALQKDLIQMAMDKNTYQSELEKFEIKKQALQDKLYDNHQFKLGQDAFVPQYAEIPLEELKKQLETLQDKLNRMSVVNLLALEEYETLSKDHEFLNNQKEDLTNSKKEIHKVISHIDELCEARFHNMLEEINLRFSKVFPIIFEGDQAEAQLILKEDEESGEAGVDILVRPPGKRPQSVTLLSRGEKALTSICLIYALFLVKPSPFCIVDEIDSPLDDANIFRLISVLKEMARKSQIITITHNKYTMKACKKLYGVTMEQPGISQLVSVNMSQQSFSEEGKTIL